MLSVPRVGDQRVSLDLSDRGYRMVYREREVNHCPGCGRTHWIIGRISAECAFCATALPLAEISDGHGSPIVRQRRQAADPAWAA